MAYYLKEDFVEFMEIYWQKLSKTLCIKYILKSNVVMSCLCLHAEWVVCIGPATMFLL